MAAEICRRVGVFLLRIPNRLKTLVASHMRFKDVSAMRPATLKRFQVRLPRFEEHLKLHSVGLLKASQAESQTLR